MQQYSFYGIWRKINTLNLPLLKHDKLQKKPMKISISKSVKIRLTASGVHLAISLIIAACAALLVFGLWYPHPYPEVSGGRSLFVLLITVDVVIGPLVTLAIFNKSKPKRELATDLTIVGFLQIAALAYGLWTVFEARPIHLVFEYSRFSVVHAADIEPSLLSKAPPALRDLPLTGPTIIALRPFRDQAESFDATMAALGGVPLAARSDLWQPYAASITEVIKESKPASDLLARFPARNNEIRASVENMGRTIAKLHYLPLVGRNGAAWTVLIDAATAEPVAYLPIDSF